MDEVSKPQKKHRTGCLIPLGLYTVVLVTGYFLTRPPLITDDFDGRVARSFWVATVSETDAGVEYGAVRLESIIERDTRRRPLEFILPEERITINVGDIHRAVVLENHGAWQLIEFNYSNTYMATSIYRAYPDRVEPVSYQVKASVGDAFVAMLFTVVAVALYLLAALINFVRNSRARKKENSGRA